MTSTSEPNLTIVYYTANTISDRTANNLLTRLDEITDGDYPLVYVSRKPLIIFEQYDSIIVDTAPSHVNIYRDALLGAKKATTKYIALCEDDQLYSYAHFKYRPRNKPFAYNLAYWGIYTWQDPPIYNYKGRKNLGNLICDRLAFIEAMEERFAKWPDESKVDTNIWAEPGKYERQLGVTVRETEDFYTHPPNVKFSHENELSFAGLGTRKRAGELRATEIPYWDKASDIRALYE